jgi:hypothetical protein
MEKLFARAARAIVCGRVAGIRANARGMPIPAQADTAHTEAAQ